MSDTGHLMIGLELQDASTVAVNIDSDGRVIARVEQPLTDPVASAIAAFDAVAHPALPVVTVGIAATALDLPACEPVLKQLAARYAGPALEPGIIASGTAAAVAETWVGAARGASEVVYFAAAERTSAGLIARGQPWLGAHGRAAAAAWLALNPVEREDYRKHGCLEAEVAAAGIVRRLVWRVKAGDRSRVQDAVGDELGAITADMVLEAARGGDGVAISVMRDTAKYLGMAAANLVAATDPEVLVLGGIMASAADLLFDQVKTELTRRLSAATSAALVVVPSALGRDAAAIGAARLAAAAIP